MQHTNRSKIKRTTLFLSLACAVFFSSVATSEASTVFSSLVKNGVVSNGTLTSISFPDTVVPAGTTIRSADIYVASGSTVLTSSLTKLGGTNTSASPWYTSSVSYSTIPNVTTSGATSGSQGEIAHLVFDTPIITTASTTVSWLITIGGATGYNQFGNTAIGCPTSGYCSTGYDSGGAPTNNLNDGGQMHMPYIVLYDTIDDSQTDRIVSIQSPTNGTTTYSTSVVFNYTYYSTQVVTPWSSAGINLKDLTLGIDVPTGETAIISEGSANYDFIQILPAGHLYLWRPYLFASSTNQYLYGEWNSFNVVTQSASSTPFIPVANC